MKRKYLVLFLAVLMLALVALGGCVDANDPGDTNAIEDTNDTGEIAEFQPLPTADQAVQVGNTVTLVGKDNALCTIELEMEADLVIQRLEEAGIDLFGWPNHRQMYNDDYRLIFYMSPVSNDWQLLSITIYTPHVTNELGIKVGDTEEQLLGYSEEMPYEVFTKVSLENSINEYQYYNSAEYMFDIYTAISDTDPSQRVVIEWKVTSI